MTYSKRCWWVMIFSCLKICMLSNSTRFRGITTLNWFMRYQCCFFFMFSVSSNFRRHAYHQEEANFSDILMCTRLNWCFIRFCLKNTSLTCCRHLHTFQRLMANEETKQNKKKWKSHTGWNVKEEEKRGKWICIYILWHISPASTSTIHLPYRLTQPAKTFHPRMRLFRHILFVLLSY